MRIASATLSALQVRVIRRLPRSKGWAAFLSKTFCVPRATIRQCYAARLTRYYSPPRFARCQFDPALRGIPGALEELNEEMGTFDGEASPMHINTQRFQDRGLTPDWVFNDLFLRQLLLHTFPRMQTDERHRMWARRWAALVYMYYRLHLPSKEVAERLGMQHNAVRFSLWSIRKRADAFLSNIPRNT